MKLSQKDKKEMRRYVEKLLEDVKEGERIHLDKDILEELLFDKDTLKNKAMGVVQYKFFTWSGDFLSKIDLSEVSFKNVIWYTIFSNVSNMEDWCFESGIDWYDNIDSITLNNTNAVITNDDLDYLSRTLGFYGCNFLNMTLPNLTISNATFCDFTNSNIDFDFEWGDIKKCNFTGACLSNYQINAEKIAVKNNIFRNSGLNIVYSFNDFLSSIMGDTTIGRKLIHEFSQMIKNDMLTGCYINGKEVLSGEARKVKSNQILGEYNNYKSYILSSIDSSFVLVPNKKS